MRRMGSLLGRISRVDRIVKRLGEKAELSTTERGSNTFFEDEPQYNIDKYMK
jgi:hypothetical protein